MDVYGGDVDSAASEGDQDSEKKKSANSGIYNILFVFLSLMQLQLYIDEVYVQSCILAGRAS